MCVGFHGYIAITIIILFPFLLKAGCSAQTPQITVNIGEQFSIPIGQSALIAGENLEVKFVEVVTDSRCPTGATCVWQGEVTCLIEISCSDALYQKALTQPSLTIEPSRTEFQGHEINFNIEPYPELGKEIKNSEYRLRLKISKGQALIDNTPPILNLV